MWNVSDSSHVLSLSLSFAKCVRFLYFSKNLLQKLSIYIVSQCFSPFVLDSVIDLSKLKWSKRENGAVSGDICARTRTFLERLAKMDCAYRDSKSRSRCVQSALSVGSSSEV